MEKFHDFKGAAKRLNDIDIPRIGAIIDVGEDELHAFMDVEAAGSGFDAKGRPKMLFEPHVFYRNLSGKKRDEAVKQGLAYPKWKKAYPKDSYPRLIKAMTIDETAALKSASWGLTQILGENHKSVGYATPQAMVKAFMEDEEHHLEACVQFLIHAGIADDLKAHRWEVVARVYNGAGYKANAYDTKMAKAFAKWQKIKDTVWSPDASQGPASPAPEAQAGRTDAVTIRVVQERLKELGYTEVGTADGKLGKLTKTAILAFKNENDVAPINDVIDQAFLDALDLAKPRDLPREDVTAEVVRKNAPEVRTNWLIKIGALVAAIPAAIGGLVDGVIGNLGFARETVKPLKEMFSDIPSEVWLISVAVIAGGAYLVARNGERKGIEAFRAGERR